VGLGKDYTIFATADGKVIYETISGGQKRVSVEPAT
jgi:ribosomal protein L27